MRWTGANRTGGVVELDELNVAALGGETVLDENSKPLQLGSLWETQIAVVLFVRHFGCLICRRQVADLGSRLGEFERLGVSVGVIGNGAPAFITAFRADTGYEGAVYTDPALRTYRALGLRRGVGSMLGFKSVKAALRATFTGYPQTRGAQGDVLQQGGALVVASGNRALYFHRNTEAGDSPPVEEILSTCAAAGGDAGNDD